MGWPLPIGPEPLERLAHKKAYPSEFFTLAVKLGTMSKGQITGMHYFIIGLFSIGLVSAHAQNVQYDFQKAILKKQFTHLEDGALSCFSGSFKAMLQQGVRDKAQMLHSAYPICGNAFRDFLIAHGTPPKKATDYIVKEANAEFDQVLSEGQ